jgi:hypothetical protein
MLSHPFNDCGGAEALDDMAWTIPQFSHEEVNKAARDLVAYYSTPSPSSDEDALGNDAWWQSYFLYDAALPIINNWRSSHS